MLNSTLVYGPVPSRRLGRSLGINNIPPKICSYSCIYCQLGRTKYMQTQRQIFYDPQDLAALAEERVSQLRKNNENIDYIAFVPDGEPTLDINLGTEIELLRKTGIDIAVITNGSVIQREDVRDALLKADWVCLKVDAVSVETWQEINRPHKQLSLDTILDGMLRFAEYFQGKLVTETMLIQGVNTGAREVNKIARFLAELKPSKAYLAVPTRPPAEPLSRATEQSINSAYQVFKSRRIETEYLIGYEGNAFSTTGDVVHDLLSITSVHPMREEAVQELLNGLGKNWGIVRQLIKDGLLVEMEYRGKKFYTRKLAHGYEGGKRISSTV